MPVDKKDMLKRLVKQGSTMRGDGTMISLPPKPTFLNTLKRGWEGIKSVADEIAPLHVETQTDKALKSSMEKANPYLTEDFKNYIKNVPMDSRAVSVSSFNKNPFQDLSPGVVVRSGGLAGAYFNSSGPKKGMGKIVLGQDDPSTILHEASHAYDAKRRDILDKSLLSYIKKNENRTPANEADWRAMRRMNIIKSKILSSPLYSNNKSKPYGIEDATELRAYNLSEPGNKEFTEEVYPKSKEMQKQYSGLLDKDKIDKGREDTGRLRSDVLRLQEKLKALRQKK